MRDKDAYLMMEALREGWGDDLGDAVGGQRYNAGGPASQSSTRYGIIPEKHYFTIRGWLGRFLKHTATEKYPDDRYYMDSAEMVRDHPFEEYQVEWLDGMLDGRSTHEEPEEIRVYSAERILAGEEQPPNTILGPNGWDRDAEPAEPGELVGLLWFKRGSFASKLTVLDNMQQYRDYSNLTTKDNILPQSDKYDDRGIRKPNVPFV